MRILEADELVQAFAYLSSAPIRNIVFTGLLRAALAFEERHSTAYGYWKGPRLEGVGLLGDVAAWSGGPEVAGALGEKARASDTPVRRLLVGSAHEVDVFLQACNDKRSGSSERQLPFTLHRGGLSGNVTSEVSLRQARREDLEDLFQIHLDLYAELVRRPLQDAEMSKQRLLRRIEGNQIWIVSDCERIVFKADVASETTEAVLLEAVWTDPNLRGRGIGSKSLLALCAGLLSTYSTVCLFLGGEQSRIRGFYERIGFKYQSDIGDLTVVRY